MDRAGMHTADCGCPTDDEFIYHSKECPVHKAHAGRHIGFEWKLQDMWIGAYWTRSGNCIDLWICFLPCIPLHISWWWTRE